MVFIKREREDSAMPESSDDDIGGSTMPYCDDKPIKQEESEISNADSLDSAISFTEEAITEEAMAWNGEDMQHLEDIFTAMSFRFQTIIHASDDPDDWRYGFSSEPEKADLQDSCCYFLEHENLPSIHQAKANLMMVWLIETETESERYADAADGIIDGLESNVFKMFGVMDERVEGLKKDLWAAREEVVRRTVEEEAEMSEADDEESDEEE